MESIEQARIIASLDCMQIACEESKTRLTGNIPIILLPVGIAGMRKGRMFEAAQKYAEIHGMTCEMIDYKAISDKYEEKFL